MKTRNSYPASKISRHFRFFIVVLRMSLLLLFTSLRELLIEFLSVRCHYLHLFTGFKLTLLEIIISVSGEEPLPVGGFLLQHHNHATKVASLLLFLFFLFFSLNN